MTYRLTVHFLDNSADFYEYSASVQTERFSGSTDAAELHGGELRDFAARLRDFPISKDDLPILTTGYGPGWLPREECMRIEIAPSGSTGTLLARVTLIDADERVSTHFESNYTMLEKFADAIARILRDGHGEAILEIDK